MPLSMKGKSTEGNVLLPRPLHIRRMSNSDCSWHGDIKPDNILWVHGKLKLADFGFAKFESNTQRSTQMSGGTHTYGTIPDLDFLPALSNLDLIRST